MKVPFTEVELSKLEGYLAKELNEGLDEHTERIIRLNEWDRAYLGDPKEAKRMFPWPGAANIEIPIIGMAVDSIVARQVNTIFSQEPLWTIRALHKDTDAIAKPLEHHLNWSRQTEFNMYRTTRSWISELTKYGWAWLKPVWEVFTIPRMITNEYGEAIRQNTIVRRPNVYHVLCRDVIKQAGVEDDEQAEWMCHNVRLTDNQLRLRKYDKVYEYVDEMIKSKDDLSSYHDDLKDSRNQPISYDEKLNSLYEFTIDWPYGPDDVPIACTVVYHKGIKKIVRAVFAPYPFKPLRKAQFIWREGHYEGLGIARRLWMMQEEISTVHRQQVDNSTLANTRFFVGRRNVVRTGTQIWPGRFLPVGDPERDIKAIQLGDIYQSQGILEMRALSYAERTSGVSDYQLGRESSVAGSRATATGTLAVIQEGNRRFDLNIRDARDILSGVGRDILLLNQMFRSRGLAYFVQGEDGKYTEEALKLPPEFEVGKMAVELTASTASINRAVEKQELIGLLGITKQYHEGLMQLAMLAVNPQVPAELKELAIKQAKSASLIMKKIVQAFDMKNVDAIVPGLVDEQQAELGGTAGSPTGDQTDGRLANLSELYREFIHSGDGGVGGSERLQ